MYKLGSHGDDRDMSGRFYGAAFEQLSAGIDNAEATALGFTAAAQVSGQSPAAGGLIPIDTGAAAPGPSYAAVNPAAPSQTVVYPLNKPESKSGVFVPSSECDGYGADPGGSAPIPYPDQTGDVIENPPAAAAPASSSALKWAAVVFGLFAIFSGGSRR